VVDTIIALAEEQNADLIVMATAGHNGILDALRGSVTEQVLRRAPFPLLAVPVDA
jgi:nucleotide-binding universal stress UspA family protein